MDIFGTIILGFGILLVLVIILSSVKIVNTVLIRGGVWTIL